MEALVLSAAGKAHRTVCAIPSPIKDNQAACENDLVRNAIDPQIDRHKVCSRYSLNRNRQEADLQV
jgi:hypothetical protein